MKLTIFEDEINLMIGSLSSSGKESKKKNLKLCENLKRQNSKRVGEITKHNPTNIRKSSVKQNRQKSSKLQG